jgi:CRP-like cAMP-binding protein
MQSSNERSLRAFLNRLTSRSALTADEQQAVLELPGTAVQVRPNRDFVPLRQRVDHSCLVVSGVVGRFKQDRDGRRQITMLHIPGDMCDLHSVVEPVATSALQALSNATILQVPHQQIRAAAARYPALSLALWRDCMVDSAIMAEAVMNVGRRDARERVAHLFCEMAIRTGSSDRENSVTYDLPITQAHVADATALTPVHVNRTLQALRNDGLLDWKSGRVDIFKWAELQHLAQFDATYLYANLKPVRGGSECSAVGLHHNPASTIVVT